MRDTRVFRQHILDLRRKRWWAVLQAKGIEPETDAALAFQIAIYDDPTHPDHRTLRKFSRSSVREFFWLPSSRPTPFLQVTIEA